MDDMGHVIVLADFNIEQGRDIVITQAHQGDDLRVVEVVPQHKVRHVQ